MDIERDNDFDMYGAAAAAEYAASACNPTLPAAASSSWEATSAKENFAANSIGLNGTDAWATSGGKDCSFTFIPATRRRNPFGKCICVLYLFVVNLLNQQVKIDIAVRVLLQHTKLPIESSSAFSVSTTERHIYMCDTYKEKKKLRLTFFHCMPEETLSTLKEGAKREYDFYEVSSPKSGQVLNTKRAIF